MHRWLNLALALLLGLAPFLAPPLAAAQPQPPQPAAEAQRLLAAMTPAEKVGQLFLVGFYGSSAAPETDIYQLIYEYHVGGVVMLSANDNITDTVQTPAAALTLTNSLQQIAVVAAERNRGTGGNLPESGTPPYIPLFVAMNHEGGGDISAEILTGLTEMPSAMAVGATWDPSQAESMGRIVGTDLAAIGVNVLLGPSLDVLETPRPEGTDLGTRVFGGDPYWVGLMGSAYIRGVHFGSTGQVAVIAKHFPGHGGSDRRPEEELPTVRKSFEDLVNFDLVPFMAVTSDTSPGGRADGLLSAHIRFQGFQGNIRQVTPPVSLDAAALAQLLALPEFAGWREQGGITMSDSLGVRAVKQFYDPSERSFNNRRVARDAFAAGNDLLLLTEFGLNPRVDQTANIIDTLAHFRQTYETDPNFAQRVDAAVVRILTLKLGLYGGTFAPGAAERPAAGLQVLGRDQSDARVLAEQAATLISPTTDELQSRAPEPPGPGQRIVFFTDIQPVQQCSFCPRRPVLAERAVEEAVVQRYGPNGTGQVRSTSLASFSFEELAEHLAGPTPAPANGETPTPLPDAVATALAGADWIVFAMLHPSGQAPPSQVVSDFLSLRPELVRARKVIVFGFGAPYFLDTTDLSKITAYYALYSHVPAMVDAAARLLFRDLAPGGASPVSVPAIDYNLFEVVKPDPSRVIELDWQPAEPAGEGTVEPGGLELGDTITLTTGILRDQNGHPVPDETPVTFRIFYTEAGPPELVELVEAPTAGGVAAIPFQLSRPGLLEITASSEPARNSTLLTVNVQPDAEIFITQIVPTPEPSDTPTPTPTPPPPTPTATPTITPTAVPPPPPPPDPRVEWRGFFVTVLGLAAVMFGGYRLGTRTDAQIRHGTRVALAGAIGLLVGYNYVALGLPGATRAHEALKVLAAPTLAVVGGALGLMVGWYLFVNLAPRAPEPRSDLTPRPPRTG